MLANTAAFAFTVALTALGYKAREFIPSFVVLYILSVVIFTICQWDKASTYNLEAPLIALGGGLHIGLQAVAYHQAFGFGSSGQIQRMLKNGRIGLVHTNYFGYDDVLKISRDICPRNFYFGRFLKTVGYQI